MKELDNHTSTKEVAKGLLILSALITALVFLVVQIIGPMLMGFSHLYRP